MALIGASGSGKSTLLSALVDDFTLSHYEPTLRLETGTCRLVGDGGWARNLVLLEGPVHDVFAARPHIGIVLVDASSLGALAEAAACISEIENFHALPPCLCVCVTKQSLDDFVSLHDVGAWAGDLGAYLAGYVDVRERNGAFFPSLMASYLNDLEIEEQRIQRIVNLALVIPSASAASVSVMNVGDDAAHVASTAQMRRAYQRVPTTSGHNTRDVVVPAARSGAASSTATPTPVVAGASGTSPSKTSDAYQRVNRQQRTLSLLRQASASLPIHTISKSVEFERGDFQRSLRQMFDRRDAAASGFIEVAVAVQLLREFDPAEMFDLDRELRSVCSALPRSSNVHGFVNFDQFCAAVCRVTSRV